MEKNIMNKKMIYICPMSRNIVDVIMEMNSEYLGFLPSRRQIDYDSGYVNNWNTKTFSEYVKSKTNILIERDHSGVDQGIGNEYISFETDTKYFDIIHIDPWKRYSKFEDGVEETIRNIRFIHNKNKNIRFEVGTEEMIREFSQNEIQKLLYELELNLSESEFKMIEYVCVQSGVSLDIVKQKNLGTFNEKKLNDSIKTITYYGKKSKEHNGDYLSTEQIKKRFEIGLDCINIGPEIAQLETQIYINNLSEHQLNEFYNVCLKSKKWEKWVTNDFDINNKEMVILVCGHYCYTKYDLPNLDTEIKKTLKEKIEKLILLCYE